MKCLSSFQFIFYVTVTLPLDYMHYAFHICTFVTESPLLWAVPTSPFFSRSVIVLLLFHVSNCWLLLELRWCWISVTGSSRYWSFVCSKVSHFLLLGVPVSWTQCFWVVTPDNVFDCFFQSTEETQEEEVISEVRMVLCMLIMYYSNRSMYWLTLVVCFKYWNCSIDSCSLGGGNLSHNNWQNCCQLHRYKSKLMLVSHVLAFRLYVRLLTSLLSRLCCRWV